MDDADIIREFVIESNENLERLDREMVDLETRPGDTDLLARVFRTVHTIKGTCGFLNFRTLEKITHQAENILSQLRAGERKLTPDLVSLVLETVDAVRTELRSIEATSKESGEGYTDLIRRQAAAAKKGDVAVPAPIAAPVALPVVAPVEPVAASTPPPDSASSAEAAKHSALTDSTIRVDVSLLNKLMNLVGELVLVRNQILQFNADRDDPVLNATSQKLDLITTELQGGVMKTRMQPIGIVWDKLPRIVRDLAKSCGKQIRLEMEGEGTELDKTLIEAIRDPLTHIVRNSCDHGIEIPSVRVAAGKPEQGRLHLRAFHEGGNVNIEISDDGGGMDPAKIRKTALEKGLLRVTDPRLNDHEILQMLFLPGFSTAKQVSNISGRGVGMDVVRSNVEKIGGTVDLSSKVGRGATVKIRIPLTLAIIPGLVVEACGERFVIPQANLLELVRLEGEVALKAIERVDGTPLYRQRGKLLPMASLTGVLGLTGGESMLDSAPDVVNVAILQAEETRFGLIVDGIHDTQEIVVKPLGNQLKGLSVYAGATIMGDGRVSLILDVPGIARASGIIGEAHGVAHEREEPLKAGGADVRKLLLFKADKFERLAVPLSLVARLEDIPRADVESSAGGLAVQYRKRIMPLIRIPQSGVNGGMPEHAGDAGAYAESLQDPVHVVVFADGEHRIGLIVDEIIDIVEDVISVSLGSRVEGRCDGMLGSAVVGGKVTDFIDLPAVIRRFDDAWLQRGPQRVEESTVLLTEESPFSRSVMRGYLEMAGHKVVEAADPKEAMTKLGEGNVNIVATSLDLPDRGAFALLDSIRQMPALRNLPVVALSAGSNGYGVVENTERFSDCLQKFDRVAMLRSLERLSTAVECEEPVGAAAGD